MVKLVLRLSPVAKIGAVAIVAGVVLGAYARVQVVPWAWRASVVLVAAGAIMYYGSRYRSFRQKRKL